MIDAVKDRLPARLELVDSNGVLPLRQRERTFTVAHSYRRWMQKNILDALVRSARRRSTGTSQATAARAFAETRSPDAGLPPISIDLLEGDGLASIPIDHAVRPSHAVKGGSVEGQRAARSGSSKNRLARLCETIAIIRTNRPRTGLSPHLHFGHVSAHEIVRGCWSTKIGRPIRPRLANGKNHGFWNTSEPAEAFLDQMLTWREMGFNLSFRHPHTYDKFESLPDWAQATLREHADDQRPAIYTLRAVRACRHG